MEGWIYKQGGLFKTWKRRYLVLHAERKPAELQYLDKKDGSPKDTILLTDARTMSHVTIDAVQKWPHHAPHWPKSVSEDCRFAVAVEERTYFFYTETPAEAEQWLQALRPITDVVDSSKADTMSASDQLIQIVQSASKEDGQALLNTATATELLSDSTPTPAPTATPPEHSSAEAELLERAVAEVQELKELFQEVGFELASWGYLGVSIGTSLGLSIGLQRANSEPLTVEQIESTGKTTVQKAVIAMLNRSRAVAADLEAELMRLHRVSISVAGFGIAIPSVTASLLFTDAPDIAVVEEGPADGDETQPAEDKADASKKKRPSKGEVVARAVLGAIGHTAGAISAVVTAPFHVVSQSALQKLTEEVRGLRQGLAAAGLGLGGNEGDPWLSVTIGTYVGVSVTVGPRVDQAKTDEVGDLSVLQRVLLSALVKAFEVGQTATDLEVKRASITLSGIGLAIPYLSATAFLGAASEAAEANVKALAANLRAKSSETLKATAAAVEKDIKEAGADLEAAARAEEHGETDRRTNFILEAVRSARDATTNAAAFAGGATIRAIYATGDAAEEVLAAIYKAATLPLSLAAKAMPHTYKDAALELERAEGVASKFPLKLDNPSLALSFGTVFGAGIRSALAWFAERTGGAVAEQGDDEVEGIDASEGGWFGEMLHRLLLVVHRSASFMRELREEHAEVSLINISVSGLGLGIPAITGSIYLGHK